MSYGPSVTSMVESVKSFAIENYSKGGWDIVIECYGDAEIGEIVKKCRTASGAIKKMAAEVGAVASYRAEIVATAF